MGSWTSATSGHPAPRTIDKDRFSIYNWTPRATNQEHGMPGELRLDDAAPWKQRFRAPVTLWTQLAKVARNRGLLASNRTGVFQLYAWDVPSGDLTQLTDRPDGKLG